MCMQCVAQSAPYITMSVGGLRAMKWSAKRKRLSLKKAPPAPERVAVG